MSYRLEIDITGKINKHPELVSLVTVSQYKVFPDGSRKLHAEGDHPAILTVGYRSGLVSEIYTAYYENGIRHRNYDRPAMLRVKIPGSTPTHAQWWYEGRKHRDGNLPAVINDSMHVYYNHGFLHRDDGPAVLRVGLCGVEEDMQYWLYGEKVTASDLPVTSPNTTILPVPTIEHGIPQKLIESLVRLCVHPPHLPDETAHKNWWLTKSNQAIYDIFQCLRVPQDKETIFRFPGFWEGDSVVRQVGFSTEKYPQPKVNEAIPAPPPAPKKVGEIQIEEF